MDVYFTIRFYGKEITIKIYDLPLMTLLREPHPDVLVEVDTQNRGVSLEHGAADIVTSSADFIASDKLIAWKLNE